MHDGGEGLSLGSSLRETVRDGARTEFSGSNLNGEVIKLCAKEDASPLKNALEKYLNAQDTNEIMLSSNRQIKACEDASKAIGRAQGLLNESELELFAYEIKSALGHVGSITKVADNEEVLDAMFSAFCLGK